MNPMIMDITSALERPGTVLLDTARSDAENRGSYLYADPVTVLEAGRLSEVRSVLRAVEKHLRRDRYVAGYLQYEAGYAFEPVLADLRLDGSGDRPLVWLGVYERRTEISTDEAFPAFGPDETPPHAEDARLEVDRADYLSDVRSVQDAIRRGDVYQINYTAPVRFRYAGDPQSLYRALRREQPVPYGAFLHTPYGHVLSCSPELFFRRRGRRIWTRPMKGTTGRGRTSREDRARARALTSDPKSRAENLMIVDLLRNDLSRICRPDSVSVGELFATETHPTLIQMTSTVEGRLHPQVDATETMRALFPCGSVTGAPKIRAMQLIHELERAPRGVYCGAIGHFTPEGETAFSVAIRTVVLDGDSGVMGTGSGIVADSVPEEEYRESRLKTRFLTRPHRPVRLIESLRWSEGYPLLDRHLDRLVRSARYFDFPVRREVVREQLRQLANDLESERIYKVRLTLDAGGRIELSSEEIRLDAGILQVALAENAVHSGDRFRLHKTTRRRRLDRIFEQARNEGFDDALLTNERGEVTEATRWNLVIGLKNRYLTPSPESGGLPGVYRSYLMDRVPNLHEGTVRLDDLVRADRIYLCNAVRGLRTATVRGGLEPGRRSTSRV